MGEETRSAPVHGRSEVNKTGRLAILTSAPKIRGLLRPGRDYLKTEIAFY
jgi:hypothetical protein